MTRHDTVKYEADSCALLLEGLQYSTKNTGRLSKSEILFAKPFELGNPLYVRYDDFIQSSRSAWQL